MIVQARMVLMPSGYPSDHLRKPKSICAIRVSMARYSPENSHCEASGKTLAGPTRLGAVARATITQTLPMTCASASVAQTWNRERVWKERLVGRNEEKTGARTYLQQNHTESDTLDSIQYAKPKPERGTEVWTSLSCPWNVQGEGGSTPKHLTPTWGAQTNSKDGKEPSMGLGNLCQDGHHNGPNEDEEGNDEQQRSPCREWRVPQERPTAAIRTTEPVITQNFRSQKPVHDPWLVTIPLILDSQGLPNDEVTTEQCLHEIRHLGRHLAIIFYRTRKRLDHR
jgi:hypothetical protein